MSLENLFLKSWYGHSCSWTKVFFPLLPLVKKVVAKKRATFLKNPFLSYTASVPVIVVGNISAGGTGKSPMVIALCELLKNQGYSPGLISRGHGAKLNEPTLLNSKSMASEVGDEPVMLARRTQCPIVVFPKRSAAIECLLSHANVDVIICDDGMQHYGLNRDIEIAMVDASRGVGNGYLLPVGPLREPIERLSSVDFVVSIAADMTPALAELPCDVMTLKMGVGKLLSLDGERTLDCHDAFVGAKDWHVLAGIGNPERFLKTLNSLGLCTPQSIKWFPDHHEFTEQDIPSMGKVVVTEKDAVKCQNLKLNNKDIWYLPISLALPEMFTATLLNKLQKIKEEKRNE